MRTALLLLLLLATTTVHGSSNEQRHLKDDEGPCAALEKAAGTWGIDPLLFVQMSGCADDAQKTEIGCANEWKAGPNDACQSDTDCPTGQECIIVAPLPGTSYCGTLESIAQLLGVDSLSENAVKKPCNEDISGGL